VLLSTDNGQSWNALSPGWTSTIVWALAFSGANVFAGTTGGVVLSTDNGTSWSAANSGLPTLDVRALMTSGSTILAGVFQKGVVLSTNHGTTWSKANIGLSNNCGGKAFTSDGSHLFAATDGGVFLSSNGGISWSAANAGLTDTIVYALAVSGSNLLALTNSGVWRRPMSEMITSVEAEARVPMQFVLHQNYPNPFNPTTVISYHLPVLSDVKLAVYDLLGREVAVLVNEKMDAGVHEVRFEASALPSGMFFYRLNAGDFVQTKRLVVLK
jgi:ligand-binding sensor domain-containing protein